MKRRDLLSATGLQEKAFDNWFVRGLLPFDVTTAPGRRAEYSECDLHALRLMVRLVNAGVGVSAARKLVVRNRGAAEAAIAALEDAE